LTFGLGAARLEGLVLEFGVRNGFSIRHLAMSVANNPDPAASMGVPAVHGFDSFEGLPEGWDMLVNREEKSNKRGLYTCKGRLPVVPPNVQLHVGWFSETLPTFLDTHDGPLRFANIDCDIYSSTIDVLRCLGTRGRIVSGSVLVFDEYIGYPNWRDHEHRALVEAAEEFGWRYKFLSFSFLSRQAVVQFL
jgi:hypothetical protein